jgi:hypothetical protein
MGRFFFEQLPIYDMTQNIEVIWLRKLLAFICVSIILATSGCVINEAEVADFRSKEFMAYLKIQNKEKLKGLFSEYTLQMFDVDAQIEEAFEFMAGDVIGVYEPAISSSDLIGPSGIRIIARIEDVATTNEGKYQIEFDYASLDEEDIGRTGLSRITIFGMDGSECEIGGDQPLVY